jgi:DNA helicase HerA-like ATPase
VFFFDEAHLLFKGAPQALIDKVEQVVRLIRSKGVGVYFVTQNPLDIPDAILGQLGNRIQHALRAFTPRDQKAVRAAADTFRANPAFSAADAIKELGVGEALVSTLGGKGVPGMVERVLIRPPASRLGPATRAEREAVIAASIFSRRYDEPVDRRSAYEMLNERAENKSKQEADAAAEKTASKKTPARSSNRQGVMEAMLKSIVRSIGSSLGRQISRGVLGSILKK